MTNKYNRVHMPFGNAFSIADPNVLKLYAQDTNTAIAISSQHQCENQYQCKYQYGMQISI